MKITIEHENAGIGFSSDEVGHNVTITHPHDDMNCTDAVRLVYWALIGASYHPDSVSKAFYEIAIEQGFDVGKYEMGDEDNE